MRTLTVVLMLAVGVSLGDAQLISEEASGESIPTGVLQAGIDSVIQAFMLTNHIPGLAACVVKSGRIGWEGYYGLANIAHQDSVQQNTIFRLASVSKPFVGTALMQLWQRGRFQLDDSINAYLPFPVRNPYFPSNVITFRQLMCHVSSIRDTWNRMPEFMGDPPIALGTYLAGYLTPGGSYYSSTNYSSSLPPANQYEYSNIGASLCGYLVEAISGIPFDQYCRDSILAPLGMTNTGWFLRDLDTTLIARPYLWNSGYFDIGLRGYAYYPAGQLRTTARSLAQFLLANISYGRLNGVRILDSATVRMMRTSHYPSIDPTQGLIWYSILLGQRLIWGHAGITDGVRSAMWLDEQRRTGVLVLANLVPVTSIVPVLEALFAMADTLTVGVRGEIADAGLPSQYHLAQNYPNPFNPSTTITYDLPTSSPVTLKVFDILGREVATLVDGEESAGTKSVSLNTGNMASGVYLYRLQAGAFSQVRKMLVVK